MILVITDSVDLSMIYATTIGGVMIGKTSIRRTNFDNKKELLREKAETDGFLSTFFRGEPYTFVHLPPEVYTLNRMMDYDTSYADPNARPIPFIPDKFEYRCDDERWGRFLPKLEDMCRNAISIVNATSDSMSGCLAFLHFQKMFQITKTITRVRPNVLSEQKILEAFNSPEDGTEIRDFGDACILYERLNWLVNCNVSNAIMKALNWKAAIAAGRIESLLLNVIKQETDPISGSSIIRLKEKKSGLIIECAAPAQTPIKKGAKVEPLGELSSGKRLRSIGSCFPILMRCGSELGMPLSEATEALWRLFIGGYISWPSPSESTPWSLKPALTAAVSQLAKQPRFKGMISPGDIERFVGWDNEGTSGGRVATIVTSLDPSSLPASDRAVYDIVGDSIVREFALPEYITPVFRCGDVSIASHEAVPAALLSGAWVVSEVVEPSDKEYKDYQLIYDVLPYFYAALTEDFRYFNSPLKNLEDWGLVEKHIGGGYTVSELGRKLLAYTSATPLVHPEDTAYWDKRFLRVTNGQASAQTVFNEITPYINDLVKSVDNVVAALNATGGIPASDCVCPVCKSPLEWDKDKKSWVCTNSPTCSFVLPGTYRKRRLTVRDMAMLVSTGESDMLFDFPGGKSGTYPGRMILNARQQLELTFASKCMCPKCKANRLNEYQWGLSCPDKRCGFTANTNRRGVRLTEEDEIAIFSGKKTRWIKGFVSEEGKPFVARLYLDNELKIRFEFPAKGKNGGTAK